MALPANIIYGVVTGRLIKAVADGPDEDDLPDAVPLQGRITFTPTIKSITDFGGSPGNGTTIPLEIVSVELDDEGNFATKLVATNYGQPQGWTWKVSFDLVSNLETKLDSFYILVPGNVITDLAHAAPIQESSGVHILQAVGMPRGGATGQAVIKLSNADYHFGFANVEAGTGGGPVLVESIQDASAIAKTFLTAADAAAARAVIGAGTSSLALGTTSTTAKQGSWKPTAADITDSGVAGRSVLTSATGAEIRASIGPTTVDELGGAQTTGKNLLKAASQADARAAIGAGTGNSNLALGTTSTTAKAGNYTPTWAEVASKPVFHNVATSGDYNQLNNKPTEVIAHTHDDLVSRLEKLELRPQIFYVENAGDPIPAEARPQDYIVYRSATEAPAVTTLKSFKMLGVPADTALTTAVVGTGDTALDAYVAGATVRVNAQGLREIELAQGTSPVTWRWSSLTLGTFSFDFGFRPVSAPPTASSTILVMSSVLQLTWQTTNTLSLTTSGAAFLAASPAMTLNSGIYRIKGWRNSTTAGTLMDIRIYAPDGSLFWGGGSGSAIVQRDVGVASGTSFIMGRTGSNGGGAFWSNMRVHNQGGELA